jgi:hypothetical protein
VFFYLAKRTKRLFGDVGLKMGVARVLGDLRHYIRFKEENIGRV